MPSRLKIQNVNCFTLFTYISDQLAACGPNQLWLIFSNKCVRGTWERFCVWLDRWGCVCVGLCPKVKWASILSYLILYGNKRYGFPKWGVGRHSGAGRFFFFSLSNLSILWKRTWRWLVQRQRRFEDTAVNVMKVMKDRDQINAKIGTIF